MRYDRLPKIALQFAPAVGDAANHSRIPEEIIWAVMASESAFDVGATSSAGAVGLMQLMSRTATELGVSDRRDPTQSIRGGAEYLRRMLMRYNNNLGDALAAYNWGPGNLSIPAKPPGRWPRETQQYVTRVAAFLKRYVG